MYRGPCWTDVLLPILLCLSCLSRSLAYYIPEQQLVDSPKTVHGSNGAVASESTICSQIGIDLLKRGGNAADAMVGTNLCVGVIGLYHSGIGGGGFMLIRDTSGNYEAVDYRESAPAAATEDMYEGNIPGSVWGGLAVAVPGELRGLEYLHNKYGVLPWRAVVNPAVHVARYGFKATEDLMRYINAALSYYPYNFLVEDPAWAKDFAPNGTLVGLGDIITRKRYADTLEKIGKHGVDIFYEGEMAESMIDAIQSTNGTMTLDDLKQYRVTTPRPVSIDYRDKYRVWSMGSPSSGAMCLSILKTMEQFPASDSSDVNLTTHRLGEAMRFGYSGRTALGDPAFVPHIDELESHMLSDSFAAAIRARILDNTTQPVTAYDPEDEGKGEDGQDRPHYYAPPGHGTSHIVTADGAGMSVTSTTTVNLLFGAGIMTPDTGVVLNNEMNDFSIPGYRNEFGFEPSPPNYVRPLKRPLSSITPLIAEHLGNGTLFLSIGAAGGSRILSSTCQVAWAVLELGLGVVEAVAAPRMHDQLMPNVATFEWRYDNETVASMAEKGHNVTWVEPVFSAVQGIQRLWDGSFVAAREVRQRRSGGMTT